MGRVRQGHFDFMSVCIWRSWLFLKWILSASKNKKKKKRFCKKDAFGEHLYEEPEFWK